MTAKMMPGGPVADAVFADLGPRIEKLVANGHTPGLGTLLVGDDEPSARYVAMKQRKAEELGCRSPHLHLPQDASQDDVVAAVRSMNDADDVDAVLFQYPAPPQIDYEAALMELDPDKDVDGMHPTNLGRLALLMPGPVPCTPAGIEALLTFYEIPVAGREVVIVGRGSTIGRPLGLLLSQKRPTANAAVTMVHTGVTDWQRYVQRAEIVIAAAGVPGMIQPEHLTPGVTVVGAGVRYDGRKLLPDVDEACEEVAGAITPRVGGVGPTTIAMLFRNFVEAAERRAGVGTVSAEPQPSDDARDVPRDDDAPPPPPGGATSDCPVCGAVVQPSELRCPSCNMTLAGIDGRPGPFSRTVLVAWAAALLVIYLVVLAVVALNPA